MNATSIGFELFIVIFTILLLLWMRKLIPQTSRGSITKNVPSLRIDHIAEKPLLRVWRGHGLNAVVAHTGTIASGPFRPLCRQVRSECRYEAQFFPSKFWK